MNHKLTASGKSFVAMLTLQNSKESRIGMIVYVRLLKVLLTRLIGRFQIYLNLEYI